MKKDHTFVRKLDAAIGMIEKVGGMITPILITFIMLLIIFDVTRRTLFNWPVSGSVELIQCLIAVSGFMAMGWTTYRNKHIRIDSLVSALPKKGAYVLNLLTSLIPLVVIIPLVRQSFVRMQQAIEYNEATSILQIPLYPFFLFMAISYVLLLLGQIMVIIRDIFGEEPTK